MYRSLLRSARMSLYQNNLGTPKTLLASSNNSHISVAILKQYHRSLIDDLHDVPPYTEIGYVRNLSMARFAEYMEEQFACSSDLAIEMYLTYPEFKNRSMYDVKKNVDLLILKGVTQTLILDNPWMLTLNHDHLKKSLQVLEEMRPKDINDFAPLILISPRTLIKIKNVMVQDKLPWKHRIYYLSKLLDTQPNKVSKYVSKWLFTVLMPFQVLDSRLKHLLKCMPSKVVAKNLWLVGLSTTTIESRIAQAMEAQYSLKPSHMKKSMEDFLDSIKEFDDQQAILGGRSLKQYLADRLRLENQTIEVVLEYEPRIKNCNVIDVDEILDYLLNEAGASPIYIVRHPQILVMPLEEIKNRFQELQSYGVQSNFLLRAASKNTKQYNDFITKLKSKQDEGAVNKE